MSFQSKFALRGRNPDVLTCIASLSNDEVFTPPELAHKMLDMLADAWAEDNAGANLWEDKTVRFLDPCTKSGVFLREITSRLTKGLGKQIPNLDQRVYHILSKQVFGIGITQITAMLARRTVYCSKHANGKHSIAKGFKNAQGNIWFERLEHSWAAERCEYCGAARSVFERSGDLESHAYTFIHTNNVEARLNAIFGDKMQFDVVIGNPPYQLDDGGYGTSAAPIYHLFVEQALKLEPRYAVFVTPSRWMAGGKGLDGFRAGMLKDKRLRNIVDYPKLYEGFPGVKIRGGISYFLWDRSYRGPCAFQTIWDGQATGPSVPRFLDVYDVLVRRNEAVPILEKVKAIGESTLDKRVSTGKPFGFRTFFHGKADSKGLKKPIKLFGSQKISWVSRSEITVNNEWIDQWKVLMTAVQGTSAAVETKFLSKPIVAEPGTACTETYLVAGRFDNERTAKYYAEYLGTRFVRFLVSLRKATQHATRDVYSFVPDVPLNQKWTDAKLYKRYGLTVQEIAFIESQVAEHSRESSDGLTNDDDQ
jgi:hypothetical protein